MTNQARSSLSMEFGARSSAEQPAVRAARTWRAKAAGKTPEARAEAERQRAEAAAEEAARRQAAFLAEVSSEAAASDTHPLRQWQLANAVAIAQQDERRRLSSRVATTPVYRAPRDGAALPLSPKKQPAAVVGQPVLLPPQQLPPAPLLQLPPIGETPPQGPPLRASAMAPGGESLSRLSLS